MQKLEARTSTAHCAQSYPSKVRKEGREGGRPLGGESKDYPSKFSSPAKPLVPNPCTDTVLWDAVKQPAPVPLQPPHQNILHSWLLW